eukprot:m.191666 g.191666  ORF g.191666 m.191666 type:complete len:125 (-) comp16761_c0_seq1:99-473(-)
MARVGKVLNCQNTNIDRQPIQRNGVFKQRTPAPPSFLHFFLFVWVFFEHQKQHFSDMQPQHKDHDAKGFTSLVEARLALECMQELLSRQARWSKSWFLHRLGELKQKNKKKLNWGKETQAAISQ